jgi:outer membrane receptor protein involved in Fe transport
MAVGTVDAKAQALEEVIVTEKREQSLQDVPIAVAAFSNEMLQKQASKTCSNYRPMTQAWL